MHSDKVVRFADDSEDQERKERFIHEFKSELNDFMYRWVPGTMTIKQFEMLTCEIHAAVEKAWNL